MSYLYANGDVVYHYDQHTDRIVKLNVRHAMSGWSHDDWEYYNCTGENYEEDGDDIWEVSQHEVFPTREDANHQAIQILQRKIESFEGSAVRLKAMLSART